MTHSQNEAPRRRPEHVGGALRQRKPRRQALPSTMDRLHAEPGTVLAAVTQHNVGLRRHVYQVESHVRRPPNFSYSRPV